ncbi:preprotein translocase subunit YajC [Streptococcus oricebi]|uniref:Preprotein translocase subunit YajC n=1 Tax=Streptococcus oricebi TaxID=1547447 RepID=A0ABS5B4A1_9STRE|nr:preprotein translocase subunit YajC [Streptococcus oricebi]MBP2623668.1 preprotein translocase subunit YajC [Streptococcus oricebi]
MNYSFLIMLVVMVGLMFFMQRSQKKQQEKRLESLKKLQKGYEVVTIGGLYGVIDEVNQDNQTVVLDVDGVYLTFELSAIKTILPQAEGQVAAETAGASDLSDESAIEE